MEIMNLRLLLQDSIQLDVAILAVVLSGGPSQAATITVISLQFSLFGASSDCVLFLYTCHYQLVNGKVYNDYIHFFKNFVFIP